jgi:hypothetical protein
MHFPSFSLSSVRPISSVASSMLLPILFVAIAPDSCTPVYRLKETQRVFVVDLYDCLIICDCRFFNITDPGNSGGAVHVKGSKHCSVEDCGFVRCASPRINEASGYGGGLWLDDANAEVHRCCGSYCHAGWYGKFAELGGASSDSFSRIVDEVTVFACPENGNGGDANGEDYMGGAISTNAGPIDIARTNFTACFSNYGSALRILSNGKLNASVLLVSGCGYDTHVDVSDQEAEITQSTFANNVAWWGAVYARNSAATLRSCTFINNRENNGHSGDHSIGAGDNGKFLLDGCFFDHSQENFTWMIESEAGTVQWDQVGLVAPSTPGSDPRCLFFSDSNPFPPSLAGLLPSLPRNSAALRASVAYWSTSLSHSVHFGVSPAFARSVIVDSSAFSLITGWLNSAGAPRAQPLMPLGKPERFGRPPW